MEPRLVGVIIILVVGFIFLVGFVLFSLEVRRNKTKWREFLKNNPKPEARLQMKRTIGYVSVRGWWRWVRCSDSSLTADVLDDRVW